jgi:hypothetical protein
MHDSTALFLVWTYFGLALTCGVLTALGLAVWANRGEEGDSFEADLADIASANVRTIIEARDAGVAADCSAVQVKEAA